MSATVYQIVTDQIIKKLEAGTVPWHRPWSGGEEFSPRNYASKKPYRGANVFMLGVQGYECPYWLSFKQVEERKGHVRKGEHGSIVVFWKWLDKPEEGGEDAAPKRGKVPVLRYYRVWNLEQCDGINWEKPIVTDNGLSPIDRCEKVVSRMPKRPEIVHREHKAYYRPATDTVNMPKFGTFDRAEDYHTTLFHELTHATGHESRLNRKSIGQMNAFGSSEYAKEELVAEMGAAFLCGHTGIENRTLDNSASYIASWLKRLRNDPKLVIHAAAQAQKATDFILGRKFED